MTGGGPAPGESGASRLKRLFVRAYSGNAHAYEPVPLRPSPLLQAGAGDLAALHAFARASPVYGEPSAVELDGGPACAAYEGDVTGHWLDSTKHDGSAAPFYPTWMVSAHALAREAAALGASEAVDVGSGDGRIAYCCALAGMRPHSVEIDGGLVRLQRGISAATGVRMGTLDAADAALVDYSSLGLRRPCFFVGALPGAGELLAGSIARAALGCRGLEAPPLFALAGVAPAAGGPPGPRWGWGGLIAGHGMRVLREVSLPTMWTAEQPADTPYIFAEGPG